jgi:hypothetical protein
MRCPQSTAGLVRRGRESFYIEGTSRKESSVKYAKRADHSYSLYSLPSRSNKPLMLTLTIPAILEASILSLYNARQTPTLSLLVIPQTSVVIDSLMDFFGMDGST